jgi:hypothetical protein
MTRHRRGFKFVRPPSLPLARSFPRMERGPLGFFPGLRTPTGRTCGARQSGDGHRALARGYATDILSALQSASSLAMCDFRVAATRSTCGWPGSSRGSHSNGTATTRSCTASARARPDMCGQRSRTGWRRLGCSCTRPRPGSSTARTARGRVATRTPRLRSWGSRSRPVRRGPRPG